MMRKLSFALALLALVVGVASCHWRTNDDDAQCDLVVVNDSSCDLKIMVDGWEAGVVREHSVRTVDDIGSGRHIIETVDRNGTVVQRRYIELSRGEDYFWRVTSC
jgi:hypothetical protein